jgi:hypothetical protein
MADGKLDLVPVEHPHGPVLGFVAAEFSGELALDKDRRVIRCPHG